MFLMAGPCVCDVLPAQQKGRREKVGAKFKFRTAELAPKAERQLQTGSIVFSWNFLSCKIILAETTTRRQPFTPQHKQ